MRVIMKESGSSISDIDYGIAKQLVMAKELGNDELSIDTMITAISMLLGKKIGGDVKNIVIFPEISKYCVNAKEDEAVSFVLKNLELNTTVKKENT